MSGLLPDGWVSVNNLVSEISEHLLTIHDAEISKSKEVDKCTSIKVVHQLDETVRDAQMEKFTQLIEENEILKMKNRLKEDEIKELKTSYSSRLMTLEKELESLKSKFDVDIDHSVQTLHELPSISEHSNSIDVPTLAPTAVSQETRTCTDTSTVEEESLNFDEIAKHFNKIPSNLTQFYDQMKDGDNILQPFQQLPTSIRKNPKTKSVFSKRKRLFEFITSHSDGAQSCINQYNHLTSSQLYGNISKKRQQM